MRGAFRRHQREEEEESAFVSMTDMTVSFLFVVMILPAFFASRFNPKESVPKAQYDQDQSRERDDLAAALAAAKAQYDHVVRERDDLAAALAVAKAQYDHVIRERDDLAAALAVAKAQYDHVIRERDDLAAALAAAKAKVASLEAEIKRLLAKLQEKESARRISDQDYERAPANLAAIA